MNLAKSKILALFIMKEDIDHLSQCLEQENST